MPPSNLDGNLDSDLVDSDLVDSDLVVHRAAASPPAASAATTARAPAARAPATAPPTTELHVDARRWRVLPAILVASFMSLFDLFVVNVAAPSIAADLNTSNAGLQLVVAGYSFTYAAGLVTGGRLGDRYGRRKLFLLGMGLFTLASALCGIAPSEATLIAGRLLQGVGAAAMVPQALALINVMFPVKERARAFAYFGVTIGLGAVSGQVLGGVLLQADLLGLGWRPLFLVNVPIGIAALVAAGRGVVESKAADPDPLDPVGLATLTAGLGLVLVPLTLGRDEGWPLWTALALASGAVMLALFGAWEARLARTGGRPIVPPAVLRSREVVGGLIVSVGFYTFFGSFMLATTIYLQDGQHRSPLDAGLVYGPLGLAFAASSLAARRLVELHGARVLTVGTSLSTVALAGITALVAADGVDVATAELVPLLMLVGVGNGLVVPALMAAVLATAPPNVSGAVGGVLATTQQFAAALGVAGIGALFFAESARGGAAAGMRAALLCDVVAAGIAVAGTFALPRAGRVVRMPRPVLQDLDGEAREIGAQRAE